MKSLEDKIAQARCSLVEATIAAKNEIEILSRHIVLGSLYKVVMDGYG